MNRTAPVLALLSLLAACGGDAPTDPALGAAGSAARADRLAGLYGLGGAAARTRACDAAEHRQFDFWLGRWEVTDSAGVPQGFNSVTSELDGCAVVEDWHDVFGSGGRSLNAYDAATGRWHQHWVDQGGRIPLRIDGGLVGGAMRMSGVHPRPGGRSVVERITWTPLGDGLRQLWETSTDGGATFAFVVFDGFYHPTDSIVLPEPVPTPLCTSAGFEHHRQLDFTLGRWHVRVGGHARAASEIVNDASGCLVEERLTGPAGYEARVFSGARTLDRLWQRTYVDNRGLRVFVQGRPDPTGAMVLTGTVPQAPGGGALDVRLRIEPVDASRHVQRWETSEDGGASWSPLVEATYTRR
jgi:hypothetical protein